MWEICGQNSELRRELLSQSGNVLLAQFGCVHGFFLSPIFAPPHFYLPSFIFLQLGFVLKLGTRPFADRVTF